MKAIRCPECDKPIYYTTFEAVGVRPCSECVSEKSKKNSE